MVLRQYYWFIYEAFIALTIIEQLALTLGIKLLLLYQIIFYLNDTIYYSIVVLDHSLIRLLVYFYVKYINHDYWFFSILI